MLINKEWKKWSYLQSPSQLYPTSKLVNVTSIKFPGGSWMSQEDSLLFGYLSGYPGEVMIPLGAVNVVFTPVN